MISKILLNWKQVTVRTQLCILGLLFIVFCSFTTPQYQQALTGDQPGWSLHNATTATDYLAESHLASNPNNDLHLTVRKQIKVKCVKKSSPQDALAAKWTQVDNSLPFSPNGYDQGARPAYYSFLFRFTLF
ncbi:hypothetical protein [Paraflavitalea speifideaquila]|uniref:hypothetical protein n=1 Tax=Paraflavitalea speifideaquila TaxID=3076558 RepID=UPI0028ECC56B|nr:hypothetical protein [Paraflavitalea speifideiaquila]